jgi:hypothetical protein
VSTTARLFIDDLPQMGEGVKRYVVDCKWGTTCLIYGPGQLEMTEAHLKTVLIQRHEDECGRCNLGRLWREHGDPDFKAAVDRTWEQLGAMALQGRRN